MFDVASQGASDDARHAASRASQWLVDRQILDGPADWQVDRPTLRPGGWAFQYRNDYYPDVDDTAVAAMVLDQDGDPGHATNRARAIEWIEGMQSSDGGWGAFDADNIQYYLNHIPFADHGALLDPPTEDVSARCVSALCQLGADKNHPSVARGLTYLRRTQQPDGSWFGRWGTNYIYGTWSVLCALNVAGEDIKAPYIRRAVSWLESRQREDGGWGEDGATYWDERRAETKESTPSQTAWAVLALMAAGEVESDAVRRGIDYLLTAPRDGARWREDWFTAVGFPARVLPALPRLRGLFPALGARPLPQFDARQPSPSDRWHVATQRRDPLPSDPTGSQSPDAIGVVTGLQAEAALVRSVAESHAPEHSVRVMCLGPEPGKGPRRGTPSVDGRCQSARQFWSGGRSQNVALAGNRDRRPRRDQRGWAASAHRRPLACRIDRLSDRR